MLSELFLKNGNQVFGMGPKSGNEDDRLRGSSPVIPTSGVSTPLLNRLDCQVAPLTS